MPGGRNIIAMWSGPRNLSTAMMRSFGSRPDCRAVDEPFYAAYLAATGIEHPMRDEIIASGQVDPAMVVQQCLQPPEPPIEIVYQKHMTHHMIPVFDISWIAHVTNVFLLRSPERVLRSYARKRQQVTPDDLGYKRQKEIFQIACDLCGEVPIVVDSADIRRDPGSVLRLLCERLSLPFCEEMLRWSPGRRPEDGIWGDYWYHEVWKSTGFSPQAPQPDGDLPAALQRIADTLRPDYDFMRIHRLIS